MAFCKFSTEYSKQNKITLDVNFVSEYLPLAPDSCVKVYLYGLSKCLKPDDITNNLEIFASDLNLSAEDVKSAFLYWQDQGLIKVLDLSPIEVRYLPVVAKKYTGKIYDKQKYEDFNASMREILDGREILPNEFKEYYDLMNSMHIEQDALVMIAKFCTTIKSNSVGYPYILAVAKNWAYEGVHTAGDVNAKLVEMESLTSEVKDVLSALKKKAPKFEDVKLYDKWTKQYNFSLETILKIAKNIKKGGIEKLDELIEKYNLSKLFSIKEIEEFESNKEALLEIAKSVCGNIGLYYQNLQPVVDNYILKWQQMGYDDKAINLISQICFKKFIRNLDGMDEIVGKYYNKGLVSIDAINDYIKDTLETDKKIKEILEKLQLSRQVTSWDRDFYRTWTYSWNFAEEVIDYALSLAMGKSQPMSYVNKILSNWKDSNIKTLEEAKKSSSFEQPKAETKKPEFVTHSFSSEELNALFDNLDEVKLV